MSKTSKYKIINIKFNNIYFTIKTTKNLLYFLIFFNFDLLLYIINNIDYEFEYKN